MGLHRPLAGSRAAPKAVTPGAAQSISPSLSQIGWCLQVLGEHQHPEQGEGVPMVSYSSVGWCLPFPFGVRLVDLRLLTV